MDLITYLRYMQFFAHISHNILGGETFFSDHEYLGELYSEYEAEYDSLVERFIGLDKDVDLLKVHSNASKALFKPESLKEAFSELLKCEEKICEACEKLNEGSTIGLGNLIASIADKSEARQFKLKKRVS